MKHFAHMLLLWAFIPAVYGTNIKLADGTTLENVKIDSVTHKGICLWHSQGVRSVLPDELSEETRKTLASEISEYQRKAAEEKIAAEKRLIHEEALKQQRLQQREKRQAKFSSQVAALNTLEPWAAFVNANRILNYYRNDKFDFSNLEELLAINTQLLIQNVPPALKEKILAPLTIERAWEKTAWTLYTKNRNSSEGRLLQGDLSTFESMFRQKLSAMKTEEMIFIILYLKTDFRRRDKYPAVRAGFQPYHHKWIGGEFSKVWQQKLLLASIDEKQLDRVVDLIDLSAVRQCMDIDVSTKKLQQGLYCKRCGGRGKIPEQRYIGAKFDSRVGYTPGTMINTGFSTPCTACNGTGRAR